MLLKTLTHNLSGTEQDKCVREQSGIGGSGSSK